MSDGSTTDPTSASSDAESSLDGVARPPVENHDSHVIMRFLVENGRLTIKGAYWPYRRKLRRHPRPSRRSKTLTRHGFGSGIVVRARNNTWAGIKGRAAVRWKKRR